MGRPRKKAKQEDKEKSEVEQEKPKLSRKEKKELLKKQIQEKNFPKEIKSQLGILNSAKETIRELQEIRESSAHFTRTPGEIALDDARISNWIRRGWSKIRIAQQLGLSVGSIHARWKKILKQSRAFRDRNIETLVTVKLEQYGEIMTEAWDAWERSKLDAVKSSTESSDFGIKSKESVEGQCGDPRYLLVVKQCLDSMTNLLGLNPDREIKMRTEVIKWETLYKTAEEVTNRVNPISAKLQQIGVQLSMQSTETTGRSVVGNIIDMPATNILPASPATPTTPVSITKQEET